MRNPVPPLVDISIFKPKISAGINDRHPRLSKFGDKYGGRTRGISNNGGRKLTEVNLIDRLKLQINAVLWIDVPERSPYGRASIRRITRSDSRKLNMLMMRKKFGYQRADCT